MLIPDGDGIVNYVEYALGLSPTISNTSALPKLVPENGQMVFRFTQPGYVGRHQLHHNPRRTWRPRTGPL